MAGAVAALTWAVLSSWAFSNPLFSCVKTPPPGDEGVLTAHCLAKGQADFGECLFSEE